MFSSLRFPALVALTLTAALCGRAQTAYSFSTIAGQTSGAGYVDGPAASARFNAPTGVVVDAAGNIYVADAGNYVIRKIAPDGTVSTVAGTAGASGTADGTGAAARFNDLHQLALAPDGTIVAADGWDGAVRRITTAGAVSTLVTGAGHSVFGDGPVSSPTTGLTGAYGVAVAPSGDIYVSETTQSGYPDSVRLLSVGGILSRVAGDYTSTPRAFTSPAGLALDASGNLYIADKGRNQILRRDPSGAVTVYAGTGQAGRVDTARLQASFNAPQGVVVDASGVVYVADTGNWVIRKIAVDGTVSTLAGLPGSGGGDDGAGAAAHFSGPTAVALDPAGDLIVTDTFNNTIRRVTPAGVVTTIAGHARSGSVDGPAASASFLRPVAIAVDGSGTRYVADASANVIRKITADGTVSTLAGSAGFAGNADGTGAAARFQYPAAVAVDAAGNVYVADLVNHLVRKISPAGVVTTLAGTGTLALSVGSGIAVDSHGNVFISDGPNRKVFRLPPGGPLAVFAGSGNQAIADGVGTAASFASPGALAVAADNSVYVVDDYQVIRRMAPDGTVSTVAGVANNTNGQQDGSLTTARFGSVVALSFDAKGNLFLTDSDTLREITADGRVVTLGGKVGESGFVDAVAGAARIAWDDGLAVAADGTVYLADNTNAVIRQAVPVPALGAPILTNPGTESRRVVAGSSVTLQIVAAGNSLTYQWYRDGVALLGQTNASLVLPAITQSDAGHYTATATNAAGSVSRDVGIISVFTPQTIGFVTRHTVAGGPALWGIAQGNGAIVAVGSSGTILSSTDGVSWTRQNSGVTDWLVGVTFGAGKFVAVGDNGRVLTSTDGATWTAVAQSATKSRLNNVAYGAGVFVAVGEAGTIITSPDAQTWTARASGVTGWLRGLAYSAAAAHFAVSGQGGVFLDSADGLAWANDVHVQVPDDLEAAIAVGSYANFVAVGQAGKFVSVSRYANVISYPPVIAGYTWTWTQADAPQTVRFRGLVQAGNGLFATGENGTIVSAPDLDGPWAVIPTGTTSNLLNGLYVGSTLYVVGENETILASDPLYASRLMNISTRGDVAPGVPMIGGFVISGTTPKPVLIRAAGPALTGFGVTGALAAPTLTLFDSHSQPMATNAGWDTASNSTAVASAAAGVGAFPFAAGSGDSALVMTLPAGAYTAQISTASASGTSLLEVYDLDPVSVTTARTVNISTRGYAGNAAKPLIAGFVISGTASRRVLIRAVGPTLGQFGVSGTVARPTLKLFDSRGVQQQVANAWSVGLGAVDVRTADNAAGAFALPEGSADSALVVTLAPGGWTVEVDDATNVGGNALVEVYDLP